MSFENYLNHDLIEKSISLKSIGLDEYAWNKETVLSVILNLHSADVGILGGDVYELIDNKILSLPDGWYCEKEKGENDKIFFPRSKKKAFEYIQKFPETEGILYLFSLVLTD